MGERPLQVVLALPCFSGILLAAVESGSERCLLLLLEARSDPNTVEETRDGDLRTPLFLALERGHLTKKSTLKMVRHLLAHGADTEGSGPQGQTGSITPLYYVASLGDLPSLTLLIQARAAVNSVLFGGSALTVAGEKGAASCVQQLLQSKAHVDHQTTGGHTALSVSSHHGNMGVWPRYYSSIGRL